jgi:hypothetical protein
MNAPSSHQKKFTRTQKHIFVRPWQLAASFDGG